MSSEIEVKREGPSERDVMIYVCRKIRGVSIRRTAKRFNLSPTRISQIVEEIEPWALRQLVAESPDRMTLKLRSHARYEHIWEQANRGWLRSLKNSVTEKDRSDKDGGSNETITKGQAGDSSFLKVMDSAEKAIRDLWGLDDPKPGEGKSGLQLNVNGGECRIVIVEDEHWYRNNAHDKALPSEAPSAPIAGAAVGGSLQSGGMRPTVGKNGSGANGAH